MNAKKNSSFAAKIKNGVRNMRSTFNILFYVNKSKEKNGMVPVMGRVTINGTQSQFSCKKTIPLDMWDVKVNCSTEKCALGYTLLWHNCPLHPTCQAGWTSYN